MWHASVKAVLAHLHRHFCKSELQGQHLLLGKVKQNRSVLALCWRANPDIKIPRMHYAAEPVMFQAILHKSRANDGVICMAEVLFDQQKSTML